MSYMTSRKVRRIIKIVYKNKPKKHHKLYGKLMMDNKKTYRKLTKNAEQLKRQPKKPARKKHTNTLINNK